MKNSHIVWTGAVLMSVSALATGTEVINTPYTWFCEDVDKAHGRCTTEWSGAGGITPPKLLFSCRHYRNSSRLGIDEYVVDDLTANGVQHSQQLDSPLAGTANYCTKNLSYVQELWLTGVQRFRDDESFCRSYSATQSNGGEEN